MLSTISALLRITFDSEMSFGMMIFGKQIRFDMLYDLAYTKFCITMRNKIVMYIHLSYH